MPTRAIVSIIMVSCLAANKTTRRATPPNEALPRSGKKAQARRVSETIKAQFPMRAGSTFARRQTHLPAPSFLQTLRIDNDFTSRTAEQHLERVQHVSAEDAQSTNKIRLQPAWMLLSIQQLRFRGDTARKRWDFATPPRQNQSTALSSSMALVLQNMTCLGRGRG